MPAQCLEHRAGGSPPKLDRLIGGYTGQDLAIWTEDYQQRLDTIAAQEHRALAIAHLPRMYRVIVACRDHTLPIWAEHRANQRAAWPGQHMNLLAGVDRPHTRGVIQAAAEQPASIRAEGQRADLIRMAAQQAPALRWVRCLQRPKANRPIRPAGRQHLPI